MDTINIEFDDDLAIVHLNRPKAHAINSLMVQELIEAFDRLASADKVRGAILTGSGSIFCAGLDLFELYDCDETEYRRFWEAFGRMLRDLAAFPKPLVAAINGHAPAGGCAMALCCDYRIMAEGKGRIGLNEVPVGIVIPHQIADLARFTVGNTGAMHMLLNGVLMDPEEAHEFGVVNENCPPDLLLKVCKKRIRKWMALDQVAWRSAKEAIKAPLVASLDVDPNTAYDATIRHWWSPESRAAMRERIEQLKSGKK